MTLSINIFISQISVSEFLNEVGCAENLYEKKLMELHHDLCFDGYASFFNPLLAV